jgi:DNA-directed RNA polymerase III subunit RPC3
VRIAIQRGCSTYGQLNCCFIALDYVTNPCDAHRYVDLSKACSVLLGNLYKTLYNINVRKQTETEEASVKAVLEKRERSDVSQDEGLLTRNERETLREWESRIEKLTVLEARVEEVVFILKDLDGIGPSLL